MNTTSTALRKRSNLVAFGLILYTLLSMLLYWIEPYLQKLYASCKEKDPQKQAALLQQLQENTDSSGAICIVMVVLGVGMLWLLYHKMLPARTVFTRTHKMTGKAFLFLLCVFFSGQLIYSLAGNLLEFSLRLFGYTAMTQLTAASSTSTTLSMFLYTSIAAPICEELIYRGFVLRSFQGYGKVFSIVLSALLFGVMHANLFQMLFAFLVGLVLGYVATEYSIFWSMVLHLLNNFVFGDLLSTLFSHLSATVQDYLYRGINITFFAIGAFLLLHYREILIRYVQENKSPKSYLLLALTTVGMLVFFGANLVIAFSGIHAL